MKTATATEIVLDLASQQWGMVTTAQAKEAGVSAVMLSRLVEKSVLARVRSGVYLSTSAGWSSATEVRAQWMALEPKVMAADRLGAQPSAVVSHESAAELRRIGDLESPQICFTVPTRRQSRQPEVMFRISKLNDEDWDVVDGMPVTTAVRTLTDLARAGHEPGHLTDMIGDILQQRAATRAEVADALVDIADILTITPHTAEGARAWLDERFPGPAPSSRTVENLQETVSQVLAAMPPPSIQQMRVLQEIIEKSLGPVQEQMQSVLEALNSSPAIRQAFAQIPDTVTHIPALQQKVLDAAEPRTSAFDSLSSHQFADVDFQDFSGSEDFRGEHAEE